MSRFHADYLEPCGNNLLVYKWNPRWNRYENTHMFPKEMEREAKLCVRTPPTTKKRQ